MTFSLHRYEYDILSESSPVESSLLKPAEWLQWNISAETADYIHRAIDNNDRYVWYCTYSMCCVHDTFLSMHYIAVFEMWTYS